MASNGAAPIFSLLATIVRVACSVIAAGIVIYAVFALFEANPQIGLVRVAADWRTTLGWYTKDLFTPSDPRIAETIKPVSRR